MRGISVQTTLATFILALTLISGIESVRGERAAPALFQFKTAIREVCDQKVVADFQPWFEDFGVKHFMAERVNLGVDAFRLAQLELLEHEKLLSSYIQEYKKQFETLANYPRFKLEIQMQKLTFYIQNILQY